MIVDGASYRASCAGAVHKTIKKVSHDIEAIKFNTAIASLMSLVNEFYKAGGVTREEYRTLLLLLNPFAPHITEELWEIMGYPLTLSGASWPTYDEAQTVSDTVEMAVMIGGKVKAKITVPADASEETVKAAALENEAVTRALAGKTVKKLIVVSGKLVNIVAV